MTSKHIFFSVLALVIVSSGCTSDIDGEKPTKETFQEDKELNEGKVFRHIYTLPNIRSPKKANDAASVVKVRLEHANISSNVETANKNGNWQIIIKTKENSQSRLKELIKSKEFKAVFNYTTSGESLEIKKNHNVKVKDDFVLVSNEKISIGNQKQIEDTKIKLERIDERKAHLLVKIFDSNDIRQINNGKTEIKKDSNIYKYSIQILLDYNTAQRIKNVAQNFKTVQKGENKWLAHQNEKEARLYFINDEKVKNSLKITAGFKKKPIRSLSIKDEAETKEKAQKQVSNLKARIKSGEIPTKIEFLKVEQVES